MLLRSARERALQTVAYELGGLAIVTPLYGLATGHTSADSLILLISVAVTCLCWAAVHNTAFDWLEARLTGRVASDRPQRLRLVHAASHEVSSIIVSTPIIMLVADMGLWQALLTDIGLTLAYTGYAYVFHMAYDKLRPMVRKNPVDKIRRASLHMKPANDNWNRANALREIG
jgi:uncharacterized membrane protein